MRETVRLSITPAYDTFGGNPKWIAIMADTEKESNIKTGEGDTIERALTNLAINLGIEVKLAWDRQEREHEEARLAESR